MNGLKCGATMIHVDLSLGEGVVTRIDKINDRIFVKFGQTEKCFPYPDELEKGYLYKKTQ